MTSQLNEADMLIMGSDECDAIWGSEYRADVHICITSPGEDKGSCNVREATSTVSLSPQYSFIPLLTSDNFMT